MDTKDRKRPGSAPEPVEPSAENRPEYSSAARAKDFSPEQKAEITSRLEDLGYI